MVPRRRSRSMSRRRRRPATSSTTSRRPERARTRTHIRTRTHARARALCCAVLRNGAARPAPTTRLWCAQALAWLGDLLLVNESVNDQLFVLKLAVAKSGRAQPRLSVCPADCGGPHPGAVGVGFGLADTRSTGSICCCAMARSTRAVASTERRASRRASRSRRSCTSARAPRSCLQRSTWPTSSGSSRPDPAPLTQPRRAHAAPPRPRGPAPPTPYHAGVRSARRGTPPWALRRHR